MLSETEQGNRTRHQSLKESTDVTIRNISDEMKDVQQCKSFIINIITLAIINGFYQTKGPK
ncbi:hypothetical protein CHS0354_032356, partial [Potamilus streckersoni]